MYVCSLSASMSFREAAQAFLDARSAPDTQARVQYISKRTYRDYQQQLKTLGVFFGELRLGEIHVGHLAEYQRARAAGDGFTRRVGNRKDAPLVASPAGAQKINAELALLKRMMEDAGTWKKDLRRFYKPFQTVESEFLPALSPDQQDYFLAAASGNPEWRTVWWYSLAALHLTFSSDEMRTIRIGDINLTHQLIGVNRRYGKNKYRRREIPICDGACVWALERLIERAKDIAGGQPHHFLFPLRIVRNSYDPEQHMSETGLRKQFDAVRIAAGVPWFRFNGFRHTAITRLAEAGVPIATIMQRSGHVTQKMSEHYTHISEQAHRMAILGAVQRKPVMSVGASQLHSQVSGWR